MWCVGVVTCTRNARKRAIHQRYQLATTASWWTERNLIPPTIEAACSTRKVGLSLSESRRERPRIQRGVLFQPHRPWTLLRGGVTQQHTATAAASAALGCTGLPSQSGRNECLPPLRHSQQQAASNSPLNMFEVVAKIFQ
jgi:hypothetical protein